MNPVTLSNASLSESWQKLGATREFAPPALEQCRLFVLGESKTGKTTLVSGMEGCLILDFEGGGHSVPNSKAYRIWVPVYSQQEVTPDLQAVAARTKRTIVALETVMGQLERDAKSGKPVFQHVVFDSGDRLQELCMARLSVEKGRDIREHAGGKGGWALVAERCLSFPRRLYSLGYGWTVIGHLKTVTKELGDRVIEKERPAIIPGFYGGLKAEADYILGVSRAVNYNPATRGQATTFSIDTQTNPSRDEDSQNGGRINLPVNIRGIPLGGGWDALKAAYAAEVEKIRQTLAA